MKRISDNGFKAGKLTKTKRRRTSLDRGRALASFAQKGRRNDLLPELKMENVAVASLVPSPHRTRTTTPAQLERVTRSIVEWGFDQPILRRGNEIIDGHVRVDAAKLQGFEEVPAIDLPHLDEAEVRQLRLALNRTGELGQWDFEALKIEFEQLLEMGVDLDATGFSAEDQDIILLDPEPAGDANEEIEPPVVPVTQPGDLWQLDGHRVLCGDSRALTASLPICPTT
jgi:hypothetical protein